MAVGQRPMLFWSPAGNALDIRHSPAQQRKPTGAFSLDQRPEGFTNERMHFMQAGQLLGDAYEVVIKRDSSSHGRRCIYTPACAFSLRSAYSGNASASSSTCRRILPSTAVSVRPFSASAIHRPTCRISFSFIPRVVSAGVPMRIPLGFIGGFTSNGIAFLLMVIP